MISKLVLLLTAIHAVCAAVLPAATPTQTADASRATPTLAPRCDDGDCSFGGSATTLQASTVTTTVMSVTSVPCYTTVFVTKGTTTTETVYSTETVTKTETKSGTVSGNGSGDQTGALISCPGVCCDVLTYARHHEFDLYQRACYHADTNDVLDHLLRFCGNEDDLD